jgi:hypothetical protein
MNKININKLIVGNKIRTLGESTFFMGHIKKLEISRLPWFYIPTYIDADYIVLELLNHPDQHMYLLANYESIQKI